MSLAPLVLCALVPLVQVSGIAPDPTSEAPVRGDPPRPGWVESYWFPPAAGHRHGFPGTSLCHPGTAETAPCPCANAGLAGRGCDNSAGTGGAMLEALGAPHRTVVLRAEGVMPQALCLFLQGDALVDGGVPFGDGIRCIGGMLRILYVEHASGGLVHAPTAGEPSLPSASAAQGVPITPGSPRYYQVSYRDPAPAHCPLPYGNVWNVSNAVAVPW